jgi:hypothetical protein
MTDTLPPGDFIGWVLPHRRGTWRPLVGCDTEAGARSLLKAAMSSLPLAGWVCVTPRNERPEDRPEAQP